MDTWLFFSPILSACPICCSYGQSFSLPPSLSLSLSLSLFPFSFQCIVKIDNCKVKSYGNWLSIWDMHFGSTLLLCIIKIIKGMVIIFLLWILRPCMVLWDIHFLCQASSFTHAGMENSFMHGMNWLTYVLRNKFYFLKTRPCMLNSHL